MNPIPIIEEYLGRELTLESAQQLASAPNDHIVGLIASLEHFYFDWLENAERDPEGKAGGYLYCVDSAHEAGDWRTRLDECKRYLLYMPKFVVPDPLASTLKPLLTLAKLLGSIMIDDNLRQDLQSALSLLAGLSIASREGEILLFPQEFAFDYTSVQEGAQRELAALEASVTRDAYYKPILETLDEYTRSRDNVNRLKKGTSTPVEAQKDAPSTVDNAWLVKNYYTGGVKVAGQICARLDLSPVAGNEVSRVVLQQEYNLGTIEKPIAQGIHKMAQVLARYEVPGIANADIATILALRQNEAVFNDFRREFANLLQHATRQSPIDQHQFEVEFKQACDDLLQPKIDELRKATKSSVTEKFFIPAALGLGAGAAAFAITGDLAATSLTALGATPWNWVLDKVRKRWNAAGRKSMALIEAYGLLSDFRL